MNSTMQKGLSTCGHLDQLVLKELSKVQQWKDELGQLPKGSLYCSVRPNGIFYYHCIDRKKKGITRDPDFIHALARKKYLRLKINGVFKELQQISNMMSAGMKSRSSSAVGSRRTRRTNTYLTFKTLGSSDRGDPALKDLLERYCELGLDIMRVTCSRDQYLWASADYQRNTQNMEQLIFETYSGIKVRSKSEQSIGNALELRGIPYRYEQALEFDVSWMDDVSGAYLGIYKTYYPDFIIPTGSGEYILWEHLGRVDLPGYRSHNMEKISAYRHSGHIQDSHLILTFEKDLESLQTIDQLIESRVLPYIS